MNKQSFSSSKTLTYSSFVIASIVLIVAFLTATTYIQLAIAILLYPLLVYFGFKVFPRKAHTYQPQVESTENTGIFDIDKRLFLKLIGISGLSILIYSLFNKKTDGLLRGIAPAGSESIAIKDTSGNKIDPAQAQPTDGYKISEIDDNIITFYGFTDQNGAWFIMRTDTDTGAVRYGKGNSNFPGNWNNREKLKYDYYNNIFTDFAQ